MAGTTPLKLDNIFVGNHSVKITKTGYSDYTQTVTIDEGKTVTINTTLTKQTAATPAATSPTITKGKTSAPYKVGDYYNDGTKEGVVFEVSADGKHGKIVSMTQSARVLPWSSDATEKSRLVGADSQTDGAANMAKIKVVSDWKSKYPAFKWCADLGDGWYLPAIEELKKFTINDTIHNAVNRTLEAKGANKLCNRGEYDCYWSSTEEDRQFDVVFCAWYVSMSYGDTFNGSKGRNRYVRAVSAF